MNWRAWCAPGEIITYGLICPTMGKAPSFVTGRHWEKRGGDSTRFKLAEPVEPRINQQTDMAVEGITVTGASSDSLRSRVGKLYPAKRVPVLKSKFECTVPQLSAQLKEVNYFSRMG